MIVNKGNKRYKHLTQDDRNILEIILQNAATYDYMSKRNIKLFYRQE